MSETEKVERETMTPVFKRIIIKTSAILLPIFVCIVAVIAILIFWDIYDRELTEVIQKTPRNEIVIYVVSWIILIIISALSSLQIRDIIRQSKNVLIMRANYIAVIIALVLIIFLFKQSFLDRLFAVGDTKFWVESILFTAGAGTGWVVWYLRQLKNYGEFFNVFLFATVVGLCWYARLTAPEEIQLTAVAFLLGSLFRVAKDYIDQAHES